MADIDRCVSSMLDATPPILASPDNVQYSSLRVRDLLDRSGQLVNAGWREDEPLAAVKINPQESLWPALRRLGFDAFTSRAAYRRAGAALEVVGVERSPTPSLVYLGVGIYWPVLEVFELTRRPKLTECHLLMWLANGFGDSAERWFALFRDRQQIQRLFDQPDWMILARYPAMRGQGSRASVARALLRLVLLEQSPAAWQAAYQALSHHPGHLQPQLRDWIEQVERRVFATDSPRS